jgi:hypothetical protein
VAAQRRRRGAEKADKTFGLENVSQNRERGHEQAANNEPDKNLSDGHFCPRLKLNWNAKPTGMQAATASMTAVEIHPRTIAASGI